MTDREKVNAWLNSIGEFDQESRDEVLTACKEIEARRYYVGRANNG